MLALDRVGSAQGLPPQTGGQWAGPFALGALPDWTLPDPNLPTQPNAYESIGGNKYILHGELSSAALIPPASETVSGPDVGKILTWNQQSEWTWVPGSPSGSYQANSAAPDLTRTRKVWVLDPAGPSVTSLPLGPGTSEPAVNTDIFCAGHTWTPRGMLLISGGADAMWDPFPTNGAIGSFEYSPNPSTGQPHFVEIAPTTRRRWYPTVITLATGDALTLGGIIDECFTVPNTHANYPYAPLNRPWEIYPASLPPQSNVLTWMFQDPTAYPVDKVWHYYPRAFPVRGGGVFVAFDVHVGVPFHRDSANPAQNPYKFGNPPEKCYTGWPDLDKGSYFFDPYSNPATLTKQAAIPPESRFYGNAVMFESFMAHDARVFEICGSPHAPTTGGTTIPQQQVLTDVREFSNSAITGAGGGSMDKAGLGGGSSIGRMFANSVALPDESILMVGGARVDDINTSTALSAFDIVKDPEVFKPGAVGAPGTWTPMNQHSQDRLYHSLALLLPDARVLCVGGRTSTTQQVGVGLRPGDTVEIFSPPYLHLGPRPVITQLSSKIAHYGQSLTVDARYSRPLDANTRITLIRAASVTHNFDFDARLVKLQVQQIQNPSAGIFQITVNAPSGPDVAPSGWYMMFLVAPNGVPSVADWVKVQS